MYATDMETLMSMQEVRTTYPDQWVLLEDPEYDPSQGLVRGRAVATGPDRQAVWRLMGERARDQLQRTGRKGFYTVIFAGEHKQDALLLL